MGKEADWSLFEVILYISSERTVQINEKISITWLLHKEQICDLPDRMQDY
jgi:hypothetical protein